MTYQVRENKDEKSLPKKCLSCEYRIHNLCSKKHLMINSTKPYDVSLMKHCRKVWWKND